MKELDELTVEEAVKELGELGSENDPVWWSGEIHKEITPTDLLSLSLSGPHCEALARNVDIAYFGMEVDAKLYGTLAEMVGDRRETCYRREARYYPKESKSASSAACPTSSRDRVQTLMYLLARDHLPTGTVEKLLRQVDSASHHSGAVFSDEHLSKWAGAEASRIMDGPKGWTPAHPSGPAFPNSNASKP